jgi:chromosome segregation ATPase
VLISTNSIDRQVKVRQDLVQTALTAAGVDYECFDGSTSTNMDNNDEHILLRNELFALSGLRGVYPQFFIVDLINGGTTFWGTFNEFQNANDDGQLTTIFGDIVNVNNTDGYVTEQGDAHPMVSPPSAVVISSSRDRPSTRMDTAATTIPDNVLENFSNQIKRIEENHQIERNEVEQQHKSEIQQLTTMHQTVVQSKKELEDRLLSDLKKKDEQFDEICRRNEGYRLKLDVLKREVAGTQELLQARELDFKKLQEKHLHDLRAIEKQSNVVEHRATQSNEEVQKLQTALQATQVELHTLKLDHETLMGRTKSVATELKDRRTECRHLHGVVDEATEKNHILQSTVESLEERLNHQGMSQTDKDGEMEQLRGKLLEADLEMKEMEKLWKEKEAKSELILTEYKKRAQHSLAMANSRTASAVQAREEAELDARAARATADSAAERATKAEVACRETIADARVKVEAMTKERDVAMKSLELVKEELSVNLLKLTMTQQELDKVTVTTERKNMELQRLSDEIVEAEARAASTQQKLMETTNDADSLREEVLVLRDQLQRVAAEAAISKMQTDDDRDSKYVPSSMNGSHEDGDDSTAAALRLELSEANDAIEDLKAALMNAIQMNEQQQDQKINEPVSSVESIPLFYAMEKQAELKTARAEMNRLASVIADVQSEKMEAYEAMEEMRRKMDDAEARLRRYEKLGSTASAVSETRTPTEHNVNTAINIEYLKHIMLRYMNAKSFKERKALVPVIAAVLELTPDEVQAAMKSLEQSTTSGVVGSKLFGFMA